MLVTVSCTSHKAEVSSISVTADERVWLTQFFKDVMLSEDAIYTLWGSKPMTIIAIEIYSDEENQALYDALTEEEKKEGFYCVGYSLDKTWFEWEKIQDRFSMNRFMFFKTDQFGSDEHVIFVLFVDILKTAATIQDNYEDFRKAIGHDFHPLELTLDMKKKDSVLIDKLKGNAHLFGILFGYGRMNSYLFQWQHFDHPASTEDYCTNIVSFSSQEPITGYYRYSIDQFGIPDFKSFLEIDPVVENYKKERERIKEIYKGKDFLDLTLKKITE